jgi:hypothetical protein
MSDSVIDSETNAINQPETQSDPPEDTNPVFKRVMNSWQEYYTNLKDHERKRIVANSVKSEFDIEFLPDYNLQTGELIADGYTRKYTRRKIPTKLAHEIEIQRGKFRRERDPEKATKLLIDLYAMMAKIYLVDDKGHPMQRADFEKTDWEQVKSVLDGCNHGTVYGRHPLESKTSNA